MFSLVSIIITTYKGEDTLRNAIMSVLNQTYSNIELIVVDDNEPDSIQRLNTKSIIDAINDSRIKYIECPKHVNGAYARNIGIRSAIGEYIGFLDDDDLYSSRRIELCVDYLKCNPEYHSVYTNVLVIFETLIGNIVKAYKSGDLQKELLLNKNLLGTGSNMFFTREAVKRVGFFDESFERHQDVEYMIRFFDKFKIIALPEYLVIKINNKGKNIPNIEKLSLIKKQFFSKFAPEIKKMDVNEYDLFIFQELKELYLVGILKKETNEKIEKICKEFSQTYNGRLEFKTKFIIKFKAKLRPYLKKILFWVKTKKHSRILYSDNKINECYSEFFDV